MKDMAEGDAARHIVKNKQQDGLWDKSLKDGVYSDFPKTPDTGADKGASAK